MDRTRLAIEQPSQVAAQIAYSKDVDVHAASSFNGLNGAQRLNVRNDLELTGVVTVMWQI